MPSSSKTDPRLLRDEVWTALAQVMDPELDEPITELGFVRRCEVEGTSARVRIQLPTFFCAPNFAWLMVADARDAVLAVEGITSVDVGIDDYFASDEINAGVARTATFVDSFAGSAAGEAAGELDGLRRQFQRKAYVAAVERVCRGLLSEPSGPVGLSGLVLGDVPFSPDRARLLRRRQDLGLPVSNASPLLLDEMGRVLDPAELGDWLRRAQTVRVNIEGNGELCRGLLRTRYHLGELESRLAETGP